MLVEGDGDAAADLLDDGERVAVTVDFATEGDSDSVADMLEDGEEVVVSVDVSTADALQDGVGEAELEAVEVYELEVDDDGDDVGTTDGVFEGVNAGVLATMLLVSIIRPCTRIANLFAAPEWG
jgi:hypothetical protein